MRGQTRIYTIKCAGTELITVNDVINSRIDGCNVNTGEGEINEHAG